ncbi:Ig-like domain-containing protein [Blautia sp. DFI.3.45]|uniref:Ig-like domain-containing protein n=1 Tax=Blautia sp. DFI.3.45 TaxID=2885261 RepID=UPI001D0BA444|nr:Ig-like domain-containing protein [Blautia sp. DFI.3.45]MCB8624862.1 Ig-like domain-containing protein [Blautia sp. DFI.3.45]
MKKRILSGILALTMCFSMTPSIAWGSGMTEFSDGASGESEKKEEFTDEPEIEEEKEQPVAAAGVPEVENGFTDGTLDAAQDTSATTKHTVTIDTSPSYKIGTDTIYDVINNHDGTLTVGEDPEIIASSGKLNKKYSIKYRSEKRISDYAQNVKNPESNDERYYGIKSLTSIPVEKKINITNICTLFCVVTLVGIGGDKLANYQGVENPIRVNYDLQGGSGGPTTDWVWNADGLWKNDHDTKPTKAGYKFAGWYTQANGKGSKIEGVSQAVNAAVAGSNNYKEITLYAKWVHKHAWNYSLSGDTLKAYCSNTTSQCDYYGTGSDNAKATVSLKLNGFDNNNCAEYGNSYSVTCANSLPSEIGATIGSIIYAGRDGTTFSESETLPTSPGKYKAKVNITLPGEQYSGEISTDFEIKKAPVTLTVFLDDFTYGEQPAIQIWAAPSDSKVVYQYKVKDEDDSTYAGITEEGLKKLSAGEYTLKAVVEETANYEGDSDTCIFKVKKASTTNSDSKVSISGWTYGGYNGVENTPSIDSSLNPENQTVQYTYYTDGACSTQTSTKNGAETEGGVPKNAGTYYVKAQIPESANYNAGTATGTFEIKPLPAQLDWSSSDLTYNGKDQTVTAKVTNALPGDTFTLTYETNETYTNTGKNARKYTAKVTALGNTNYSLSEEESVYSWEIKKASTTNSASKVSINGWTYGGYNGAKNTPSIDPSLNPENQTVQYTYYTDGACSTQTSTENGAETEGGVPKNAGTYYVKAQIPESANYNAGTATGTFEIKPLPVKLDWSSSDLTYNGKDQTVTAKVTNALPGDTFTLTYETNETYTNTGKNARKYTAKVTALGNTNYSFIQEESIHPWVINPKAVTVKPDDLYKHIGGEEPQLTYTTDGIVEGETLSGITLQRESGEDARKYTITATETEGENPNYTVTQKTGTFTIEDHKWPKDGKILSPATSWSEGMKERTCTVPGCGQKRYDAIPKQDGKPADPYADKIDKYIQIFGSEITAAALDNEETILFGLFPESDKTRIDNGSRAKVWLEINHVNNLDPDWQNLINTEIEKTVGKNADRILFDIDLYRQLAGENRVLITDPGINMNIRIKIPDKMINNQPYTIREYKILRLHEDSATNQATVDILDSVFNSSTNELTFKSDKFSIYVLTYKDTYYSPSYPVTGIKVSPDTLTLTKKDETAQLTAEVTPSYADNKRVTWQSSDEKVATVDENGKVTAVGNGTAAINATSVSGSYTATVSVTVKIPMEIQKLTIEAEKETLTKIGESTELKVKIEPENADLQKLIWKSHNEKVAITDENGKVTAVGNGTAEITVTTEDGKITASIMITVKVPDEPTINKTTGFRRLRARSVKQTKTSVTLQWNIIKDADGYFVYGNRCNTGTKSYKYRKLATITGGDISTWTQKDLKKGTYYKYVVKAYRLVNGKKVVTDTSISVHVVTGGGKYGNAKAVSVTQIGNKKNVSKITLKMGKTAQIKAKEVKKDKKIERHRKLCYESSNTKVATVTPDGLIRATGKGTCTIWVYAQNGVYKALKITVK